MDKITGCRLTAHNCVEAEALLHFRAKVRFLDHVHDGQARLIVLRKRNGPLQRCGLIVRLIREVEEFLNRFMVISL